MEEDKLVSIIIPTYNRAHLIGETLNSIIAQSYTNWECIVVDDHSSDYTKELLEFYTIKDSRMRFFIRPSSKPKGANSCRNFGFEKSKGSYIIWFDSDDLMLHNNLNLQVGKIRKGNFDISVCQVLMFENDNINITWPRSSNIKSENILESFISAEIVWLTPSILWNRNYFKGFDRLFDEELHAAQEWEFFCRCLFYQPRAALCEKALIKVRKHEDSISYGNEGQKLKHYYKAREKVYTFLSNRNHYSIFLANYFINSYQKKVMAGKYIEALNVLYNQIIFNKAIRLHYRLKLLIVYLSYFVTGRGEVLFKGREFQ